MLTERTALETMFNDLQRDKNALMENYRRDLEQIEKRQFEILDRLQRLDDLDRKQADGVAEETKTRLGSFELPKTFVIKTLNRPEKRKITAISEQDLKKAFEEVPNELEPKPDPKAEEKPQPKKPGFTIADKIEEKLEPSDPEKGIFTGVKEFTRNGQNIKVYQCYYECVSARCGHKGKRFIAQQDIETFCHNCGRSLRVKPATKAGFPTQDRFNNFFVAGSRKTEEEIADLKELHINTSPAEHIDKVLEDYTKQRQEQEAAKAKTPSKPRSGRAARKMELAGAADPVKESKQEKLADKAPAAQTEKKVTFKNTTGENFIRAIEALIEETGPLSATIIEKELKARYNWEWANIHAKLKKDMERHPNKLFKKGAKYFLMEAGKNGQDNIQQEKATI